VSEGGGYKALPVRGSRANAHKLMGANVAAPVSVLPRLSLLLTLA
jgi:hypothetical protein